MKFDNEKVNLLLAEKVMGNDIFGEDYSKSNNVDRDFLDALVNLEDLKSVEYNSLVHPLKISEE